MILNANYSVVWPFNAASAGGLLPDHALTDGGSQTGHRFRILSPDRTASCSEHLVCLFDSI